MIAIMQSILCHTLTHEWCPARGAGGQLNCRQVDMHVAQHLFQRVCGCNLLRINSGLSRWCLTGYRCRTARAMNSQSSYDSC